MDAHELRAKAQHYRRIAELVSGEVAEALLELAADYASLADNWKNPNRPLGLRSNRRSSVRPRNR